MRIAISGASGFVGRATVAALRTAGHTVIRLQRSDARADDAAAWAPETGALDTAALGPIDAVIHLAGENIASGRWTTARRRRIADSRGPVTTRLCQTLAELTPLPAVLVAASASGIYGDRGDEWLDEQSLPGTGFLADVAMAWERGTEPARQAGIRVVNLRLGMVLDGSGGVLARLRMPFRLGVGGRLGSGRQWMSWISRDDVVRAVQFVLTGPEIAGPVVACAPNPVTNIEFTQTLARALHRPAVMPAPAWALRLVFGEMADELLLSGRRVRPSKLLEHGFQFQHATLAEALAAAFDEPKANAAAVSTG